MTHLHRAQDIKKALDVKDVEKLILLLSFIYTHKGILYMQSTQPHAVPSNLSNRHPTHTAFPLPMNKANPLTYYPPSSST